MQYNACFHDLALGVQTHVYAPLGLDIKEKWSIGGSLPGEPVQPVELGLGVPKQGLYLREDCDMRCNLMLTRFVRGTLTKAHSVLVDRLVEKAGLEQVKLDNHRISMATATTTNSSAASRQSSIYSDDGDVSTASGFPSPALTSDATSAHSISGPLAPPQLPPRTPQPPPPQHTDLPKVVELAAAATPPPPPQQPPQKPPKEPQDQQQKEKSKPTSTEPFPPFVLDNNKEFVPSPLKPRRPDQRHSYLAYQPKPKPASPLYAAYRPPPPTKGYSAYRPPSGSGSGHLSAKQPAGAQQHGRSRSEGGAWIPDQPVELEG